ncbi:MAG: hypothetical protein M3342_08255, partial [Bacteroidota bacterium]|nr:hypothetical protein [Bacteroidota bacterium]
HWQFSIEAARDKLNPAYHNANAFNERYKKLRLQCTYNQLLPALKRFQNQHTAALLLRIRLIFLLSAGYNHSF